MALIVLGVVVALVAFLAASNYTRDVNSQLGDKVSIYVLSRDVPPLTELSKEDVAAKVVPRRWIPPNAFTNESFLGRKTSVELSQSDYVTESTLVPIQEIKQGEREIAILVDAEAGVGGRIRQGDFVNVNATLEQPRTDDSDLRVSTVLIRRARIVSIGGQTDKKSEDGDTKAVVPVTFALSEANSLRLLYAESFATTIRLSKVPSDDVDPPAKADNFNSNDIAKIIGGGS